MNVLVVGLVVNYIYNIDEILQHCVYNEPSLLYVTNEAYLQYQSTGICPICKFSCFEYNSDGYPIFILDEDDAIENTMGYELIVAELAWEWAWHYYNCEGIISWWSLWDLDNIQALQYINVIAWDIITYSLWLVNDYYFELVNLIVSNLPTIDFIGFIISIFEENTLQTGLGLFVEWLNILALSVSTIWASGVGPRVSPDQLSDIGWTILLLVVVFILVIVLLLVIAY